MHNCNNVYYILLKILVASTVLVTLCSFFGPYDYRFESTEGVAYYYLCVILLGIPLLFCGKKNRELVKKEGSNNANRELTAVGEKILLGASILSLLAAVVFAAECIRLFSIEAIFAGGDFRSEFGENRSTVSKYSEILSCLGPASYLIAMKLGHVKHRLLIPVALLSLFCMGLTGLLVGARWKIFLCLLIFVFAMRYGRSSTVRIPGQLKTAFRWLFISLLVVLIIYAFFVLFSVRGQLTADEQYRFYYGDMPLKPWAAFLFDATNGAVQPIFRAVDYVGQSPFVFSYLFEHYIPDRLYYGAFALRILGYILPAMGIPFPTNSTIVEETFTGMYSGSAYGFITDFGVLLAPAVMFLVGICLAAVERRRVVSRFSSMLFPLVCSIVACSPIYYLFHVGYADYVFWWFVALYGLLSMVSAWIPDMRDDFDPPDAGKGRRHPILTKASR